MQRLREGGRRGGGGGGRLRGTPKAEPVVVHHLMRFQHLSAIAPCHEYSVFQTEADTCLDKCAHNKTPRYTHVHVRMDPPTVP